MLNNQVKENKDMKTLNIVALITLMLLGSCTSSSYIGSGYNDDVYASSKDVVIKSSQVNQQPAEKSLANNPNEVQGNAEETEYINQDTAEYYTENSSYSDGQGNTYITNNYYDDYYDYSYSARLKRFYDYNPGWGYYDSWYTNYYWYDYNPSFWGVSIYLGYNWWWPSYHRPYYYNPWSWNGWHPYHGYYGFYGYNNYYGWNNPWYPGWGYENAYWNGFSDGYNYGYNDGYWADNYYNSYDNNSYYYGPRTNITSSNIPTGSSGTNGLTFGQKYENVLGETRPNKTTFYSDISSGKVTTSNAAAKGNTEANPAGKVNGNVNNANEKPAITSEIKGQNAEVSGVGENKNPVVIEKKPVTQSSQKINTGAASKGNQMNNASSKPVYSKPATVNKGNNQGNVKTNSQGGNQSQSRTKPYTTPNYSKPKSSQQYSVPKQTNTYNYTKPNNSGNYEQNGSSNKPYYQSNPQNNKENKYYTPSGNEGRNNSGYTPSYNSGSSKSNSSYTPSRSSGGGSSPSYNSSGSGSSSRSSGGASGGGARSSGGGGSKNR